MKSTAAERVQSLPRGREVTLRNAVGKLMEIYIAQAGLGVFYEGAKERNGTRLVTRFFFRETRARVRISRSAVTRLRMQMHRRSSSFSLIICTIFLQNTIIKKKKKKQQSSDVSLLLLIVVLDI